MRLFDPRRREILKVKNECAFRVKQVQNSPQSRGWKHSEYAKAYAKRDLKLKQLLKGKD